MNSIKKILNICLAIIMLIITVFFSHFSSMTDVTIVEQNKKIYHLSIVIIVLGIIIFLSSFYALLKKLSPMGMALSMVTGGSMQMIDWTLFAYGIILIALGSYAVSVNNKSNISDENKSDIYIKISVTLASLSCSLIGVILGRYSVSYYPLHDVVA